MKVYLAARYSRRQELCIYREQLTELGFEIQARWLDGNHQLADNGIPIGENGEALVEATDPNITEKASQLRAKFALDDWEDVSTADMVISFTEEPRTKSGRGGRHVEFGIALAKGAQVIVLGHKENIFHWLPNVDFYSNWTDALDWLRYISEQGQVEQEIVIQKTKGQGFNVRIGDRYSDHLTFDEMLGQIASLTIPQKTGPLFAMMDRKGWADRHRKLLTGARDPVGGLR